MGRPFLLCRMCSRYRPSRAKRLSSAETPRPMRFPAKRLPGPASAAWARSRLSLLHLLRLLRVPLLQLLSLLSVFLF